MLGHGDVSGPRAWFAAALAALAVDLLSDVLVTLAAWLHSGTFQRDIAIWAFVTGITSAIAKTAIALLAVVAIQEEVAGAVALLAVVTAVMYLAFRAYAFLYLRHQRVEKLYRFTRAIAGSVAASDVAARSVREARELLGANEL